MLRGFPAALFVLVISASPCLAEWPPDIRSAKIEPIGRDGAVTKSLVSFRSPIQTVPSANNTAYFEYWLPKSSSPMPAVILLHYLGASDLNEEYILAEAFTAAGMAVVLPTMPYHMRRSVPGLKRGEGMVGTDTTLMRQSIGQENAELAYINDWLRARPEIDGTRLGVSGISLGAIIASLQLTADSPYEAAVLVLGGGDVADVMWNGALRIVIRKKLRRIAYTKERLSEELRSVEPLNRVSPTWKDRVLMVNAAYDPVIPRRDTVALWKALGEPDITWIDSGHYIPENSSRKQVAALATAFFQSRFGMAPSFRPQPRLAAHIIKLGVFVRPPAGVAIGGAIGITRSRPRAVRPTLDLIGNTEGLSLGGGVDIGRNLTIGFEHPLWPARHGIRPYAMVSIVL